MFYMLDGTVAQMATNLFQLQQETDFDAAGKLSILSCFIREIIWLQL